MIWLLAIFLFMSLATNVMLCFYLYKFIKIIMIFEDDISDTITSLDDVDESIKNIVHLKMFFDDAEVKQIVSEVMETIKMARFNINKMAKRFTDRSKQKYIMIQEDNEQQNIVVPEPLEVFGNSSNRKEGTLFHVGRNVQ